MITPFFTINQDDEFIYIETKISHIRFSAQNIEMIVENELFIFSLSPYYLRIRLPFPCIDDERSHAEYDSKAESVKIKIPKLNKGQFFPDLDLTTKLLARSTNYTAETALDESELREPLIEELDVDNNIAQIQTTPGKVQQDFAEGEKFNWEIAQEAAVDPSLNNNDGNIKISAIKYGFNNQFDSIVGVSVTNGNDINELGDPENTPVTDRIIERLIKENIKFDPEFYAADYIMEKYPSPDDDKSFKELLEWKNPLTRQFLKWYKAEQQLPLEERTQIMPVEFTKDEQEKMIKLPRKSYLIEEAYKPQLYTLLVSLLFAYHFDLRETEGDHNIESAWTIGRLTPQIAFLDSQILAQATDDNVLKATIITSIRRALSYPLHRNYNLTLKVWEDVYHNLRGGKRLVLKTLLDLKELFRYHDVYYVYDKIWLEDYCAWLISDDFSEATLRTLAHDLRKEYINLQKTEVTFEKVDTDEAIDIDDENDNIVALNLHEIELMAEESYHAYQNQA
ncbi:SHQ1 protein-domain-containing protein [Scheffersomyces xylosifermentans]|uniref:SHQ1 protein-domain-containing protein n=1 Tax=Scheffersomyces xylosifermentans TaxID=1304137 RepID=UPI00315C5011